MSLAIKRDVLSKIMTGVKSEVKAKILDIAIQEFRPIAIDYLSIRNSGTKDNTTVDEILSKFRRLLSLSYDSNIRLDETGINIGFGDDDLLGLGSGDFSQVYELDDFRWVSLYINGIRNRYIHLNFNVLDSGMIGYLESKGKITSEESSYFKERIGFYKTSSTELEDLIKAGKILKFAGGILLEPDFFFEEGWNLIFSPDYVSLNIESSNYFVPNVLARIKEERVIEKYLESAMSKDIQ